MNIQIRHFLSVFIVAGTLNFVAEPALAAIVTHNFTGAVTSVIGSPLGLSPSVGDPVTGSIAYDTSLPPDWDTGAVAGYLQTPPNGMSGMSVVIGDATVQSTGNSSWQVTNNYFSLFDFDAISGFFSAELVGGQSTGTMIFYLSDTTATAFSSTALPPSLNAASFNLLTGGVSMGPDTIYFSIDTLTPSAIQVKIDIKPTTYPNDIQPKNKGITPVAILTTGPSDNVATFDAANVDPATVVFGSTGTEAAPSHYALEDVDRDGDIDLILHFNTQDTGIKCEDASATLTGETFDEQIIKGTDSIETVGCE